MSNNGTQPSWGYLFEKLLQEEAIIQARLERNGTKTYQLAEPSADYQIVLVGAPRQTILIHSELFEHNISFLKSQDGQKCRCDYVLVNTDTKEVWFIELTQTREAKKSKKLKHQLKGGQGIFEYSCYLITNFIETDVTFNHSEWCYRYVVIYDKGAQRKAFGKSAELFLDKEETIPIGKITSGGRPVSYRQLQNT